MNKHKRGVMISTLQVRKSRFREVRQRSYIIREEYANYPLTPGGITTNCITTRSHRSAGGWAGNSKQAAKSYGRGQGSKLGGEKREGSRRSYRRVALTYWPTDLCARLLVRNKQRVVTDPILTPFVLFILIVWLKIVGCM